MKIQDFKNLHAGERCFVLGNGTSLQHVDFEKLKGEKTFGIHRITFMYESTDWRPSFYVSTGGKTDESWQTLHEGVPSFINKAYSKRKKLKDFPRKPNVMLLKCDSKGSVVKNDDGTFDIDKLWSYDPSKKVTIMGTGLQASVQLATYMGFSKIYFIGTDLQFDGKQTHFDPRYKSYWRSRPNHEKHFQNLVNAHELIRKACDNIGVETFNATHGGILKAYPRVKFNDLF